MICEQKHKSEEMEIHPRNRHLRFLSVYRRQVALSPRMTTTTTKIVDMKINQRFLTVLLSSSVCASLTEVCVQVPLTPHSGSQ